MRLATCMIDAKDCPIDVFVYLPKEHRFFFVDDIDKEYHKITLWHEVTIDEELGLIDEAIEFKPKDKLLIVSQYEVNKEILFDGRKTPKNAIFVE